ncbi:MAG TPA: BTAD domain-containing putative transcriptional regulator [Longimicrobium sp.]|nr:BTAD domain-containing putative transcriptional regulator [Longimicrobium sp.]
MAVYLLHLLGSPVIQGPDGPVTGRASYRRRVALLSILALARGRPVGRERIIGLLWPEHPSDGARHALSEALYVLRKDLSDELFVLVGDEVALNPAVMGSDVAAFEDAAGGARAEEAAGAYGGALLDGFYVADAPEYERWVEGERERLAHRYAQMLESLALAAEAGGCWPEAVSWWRRLATHDRYSSRVALRLVRALDTSGDRMAALRFAGTHAVLLREELGSEPDVELTGFVAQLRADPPRAGFPPVPEMGAATPPGPGAQPSTPAPGSPSAAVPVRASAGARAEVVTHEPRIPPSAPTQSQATKSTAAEELAQPPEVAAASLDRAQAGGVEEARPGAPAGAGEGGEMESGPWPLVEAAAGGDGTVRAAARGDAVTAGRGRSPRRMWRSARRWGAVRVALVTAGLAACLMAALLPLDGAPGRAAPRYDPRRVAVLYLDDYSAGGELAYLANGLTEMLVDQLSQVQALDVVSRNGVKPYRERAVPLDSLAAGLRAGTIVEGSVQRSGDSVRVTVRLIDANARLPAESRSLTFPLGPGSLFALEDGVTDEVARLLRRRVGREIHLSNLSRRARTPRALDLVLRAERARDDAARIAHGTGERDGRAALRMLGAADSLLAEAGREDPGWPEPAVLRGWVAVEGSRRMRGPLQMAALDDARRWAEAALRREPGGAAAHELRGSVLWRMVVAAPDAARGQPWLAQAERDLRAAVAADPGRASAWATLSQLLRLGGDLAEAELAAHRAVEEDAYLDVPEIGPERLYRVALALGDYPRARHWCDEGRRRFPDDFRFRDCALVLLARDASAPPSPDSAWRLVTQANRLDPPAAAAAAGRPYPAVFRQMMAAAVLARAGMGDSARAVSARARAGVEGDAELRVNFLWDDAYLSLLLGDRARAATLLDRFVAARPAFREYVLREPAFHGVWPAR